MEINKIKTIINSPQWPMMEELLRERMQTTLQALAVATSELEVYRLQGKIASLQELMKMREQIKRK
jgi:hypothetical protein